ncbi:MAG: GNAT family N-acetyltransferase [Dokdonia sp.]
MNPSLHSVRLSISLVCIDDIEDIHKLHLSPLVDQYNTLGIPTDLDETIEVVKKFIQGQQKQIPTSLNFVIRERQSNSFIGLIALNMAIQKFKMAEVWYKLLPKYWKQGYATEALEVLLSFGFQTLGLHRIEAGCAVENVASRRVLEKVGMQKEGQKRQVLPLKSGWADAYLYAILATDRKPHLASFTNT